MGFTHGLTEQIYIKASSFVYGSVLLGASFAIRAPETFSGRRDWLDVHEVAPLQASTRLRPLDCEVA